MRTKPRPESGPKQEAVVTKAVLRAADHLRVKNNVLAKIIGVSEPTVSRMRNGDHVLNPEQKPFELAVLFIRLYRSLDAIVDGDEQVAGDWLKNTNTALNGNPVDLIQSVSGLTHVIQYLDSRRAIV